MSTEVRNSLLVSLAEVVNQLSDDAVEVLVEAAQGLSKGNEIYGPLNIDDNPRDWLRDALDEARDLVNYVNIEIIRMRREVIKMRRVNR